MGIAISHGMCSCRMTHTLGTVSPVPTAILNQNPHLKHVILECVILESSFSSVVLFFPIWKTGTVWSLQRVALGEGLLELITS